MAGREGEEVELLATKAREEPQLLQLDRLHVLLLQQFFFSFYEAVLHSHTKTPLSSLFNFFICLLYFLALLHILLCFIPLYLSSFSNQPYRPHTHILTEYIAFCTEFPAPFAAVLFHATSCFSSLSFPRCLHATLLLLLYSPHHYQAQFSPLPHPSLGLLFPLMCLCPPFCLSSTNLCLLCHFLSFLRESTSSLVWPHALLARRCGASCPWGCGPCTLHVLLCVSGAHSLLLLQLCWMMAPLTLRSAAVMVI